MKKLIQKIKTELNISEMNRKHSIDYKWFEFELIKKRLKNRIKEKKIKFIQIYSKKFLTKFKKSLKFRK